VSDWDGEHAFDGVDLNGFGGSVRNIWNIDMSNRAVDEFIV
jgi:hypothetical protein